jgi:phage tail-like protein
MNTDVHTARRFYVEIAGIPQAVFTEVNGLQVEMQVQEYQEGGNNGFIHRLPGPVKVGNITLRRGLTTSNEFFKWCMEVATRTVSRRHVSILMYDTTGEPVVRWDFLNAYPVKWVGPQFTSTSQSTAIETLELAHSGLELGETPPKGPGDKARRRQVRAA